MPLGGGYGQTIRAVASCPEVQELDGGWTLHGPRPQENVLRSHLRPGETPPQGGPTSPGERSSCLPTSPLLDSQTQAMVYRVSLPRIPTGKFLKYGFLQKLVALQCTIPTNRGPRRGKLSRQQPSKRKGRRRGRSVERWDEDGVNASR